ncbi:hypothetical protein QZM15_02050 [Burkholderia sp. AU44665]|nr:hypothetical protein [Burkholderia sp. AU44665]MDN7697257.1 hypothetical protein [Burkholderia sp. AU44665]
MWHTTARSVGVAPPLALARFIGRGDFAKHLRAAKPAAASGMRRGRPRTRGMVAKSSGNCWPRPRSRSARVASPCCAAKAAVAPREIHDANGAIANGNESGLKVPRP